MAETIGLIFKGIPTGGILTDSYTVPSATSVVFSSVVACNRADSETTIRIAVADNGASDTEAQYIVYEAVLKPRETKAFVIGISLGATDVLRTYAANGQVAFNGFGSILT